MQQHTQNVAMADSRKGGMPAILGNGACGSFAKERTCSRRGFSSGCAMTRGLTVVLDHG